VEKQTTEQFEGWCIVEIMGHQTFAGYVTERAIAGAGMLQIDVPQVDEKHPAFTKLFSPSSIYGITPTTEQHAREAAAQIRVRPVTLYILPEPKSQRVAMIADREQEEIDMDAADDEGVDYGDNDGDNEEDEIGF